MDLTPGTGETDEDDVFPVFLRRWAGGAPETTGLALLAFLGAGQSPASGPYRFVVSDGLAHLLREQGEAGCYGSADAAHFLRAHAVCLLAVLRARRRDEVRDASARRGPTFLLANREKDGEDPATAARVALALRAARNADLAVPEEVVAAGVDRAEALAESGEANPRLIALGVISRRTRSRGSMAEVREGAARLEAPLDSIAVGADPETAYWILEAAFHAGGDTFGRAVTLLKAGDGALFAGQVREGEGRGSRAPGEDGSRARATAFGALALGVGVERGFVWRTWG